MLSTRKPDNALNGWHPGEQAIQAAMNLGARVSIDAVVNKLPEQHRIFHSTCLKFLPLTTLDGHGRPWASILCAKDGSASFISSPSESRLEINAHVWAGDPIIANLENARSMLRMGELPLASAIGLETSTRRRNKFAGYISSARLVEHDVSISLTVRSALGLCPKYINVRELDSFVSKNTYVAAKAWNLAEDDRLPAEVISFIHSADTAYLATSYVASPKDAELYPSHVGTNHRGGRPGFVRVRSDGRTLVLPNYAGNRLMNSLGNIFVTPLAGITFPSFTDGSILYVTGTAHTRFGAEAQKIMPGINVVTTIRTTGFSFVKQALPLRERPGATERSPYCPPIRYLAEEEPPSVDYGDISLLMIRAQIHSPQLVTYTLEASRSVEIRASQNVVLDLSQFIRTRSHELIDWVEPDKAANDDCVRTWTVSIPPPPESDSRIFSITVRTVKGGVITPVLYSFVTSEVAMREPHYETPGGTVVDLSKLKIKLDLRGIGGTLPVPEPVAACDGGRRLLWIAGGIGLTPFLSLTRHVAGLVKRNYGLWDVALVISTREPDVMLRLVADALESCAHADVGESLRYEIYLFGSEQGTSVELKTLVPTFVRLHGYASRMSRTGEFFESVGAKEREAHICGPLPFVQTAMGALQAAGVDPESVLRERFTY